MSVWDALEDDPVKREIYKLRSELIHVITEHIKVNQLKQREVAELLGISQPRVSTLMKGDFESFRLDTLIGFVSNATTRSNAWPGRSSVPAS